MDTTKARYHAEASNKLLAQKASSSGFDVRGTASYHTNVAVLELCIALDEALGTHIVTSVSDAMEEQRRGYNEGARTSE